MSEKNILLFRYPPNHRFKGAISKQVQFERNIERFGKSITDKETYRLNLVSKPGSIASGLGSANTGWYMFPDGKYSLDKDFSHVMRKDLSIVEIDDYIKKMTEERKAADEHLKAYIDTQIELAKEAKEQAKDKENSSPDE